ncbi:unnamed protein product [Trifolium pratense]|uniref:Uncharacterized protein n=1 Tax=Trifolium pratense TaxID=57577 RepID=A0ACB0JW92_TRIPR|nr:unnamed protein product [Trifolium pratense]
MNGGLFGAIFLVMHFAIAKNDCVTVLGWICTFVSICVYVAPLSIVVQVIRTKSVEYMPLALSLCLTVNAVVWSLFGLFKDTYQDVNVFFPNIIGFILGTFQMCIYWYYSRAGSRAVDVETGGRLLEDGAALGGVGPIVEAVGDCVTQLVEDGGRLIELPVGGGVGKAKEGSGREWKEGGDVVEGGAREGGDGGVGEVRVGGIGKLGEGKGGRCEVGEGGDGEMVEGGSGDREEGGTSEVAGGGEVIEGVGCGEGEESGTSEVGEGGRGGGGEEGSRGEQTEGVAIGGGVVKEGGGDGEEGGTSEVVVGGRGEVVKEGGGDGEEGGTGEVAEGGGGGELEETSEVGEEGGGEESGTMAEVGEGGEGGEGMGGGLADGAKGGGENGGGEGEDA